MAQDWWAGDEVVEPSNKSADWWSGDEVVEPRKRRKPDARRDPRPAPPRRPVDPATLTPSGQNYDGDTYRTRGGANARLGGVDAFELRQNALIGLPGAPLPVGVMGRNALSQFAVPEATAKPQGQAAWGRPQVALSRDGQDAGESLIRQGLAVPVPRYLQPNEPEGLTNDLPPDVRANYMAAQREAIATEQGAYAGRYQSPADFRAQGKDAPWQGKILMTPDQAGEWEQLVRNPTTTPEQVGAWLTMQGHKAENVRNVVRFLSRNPQAEANPAFQQQDAEGNPVQPEQRGLILRSLDALNEGIIDIVASPLDLSHAIATPFAEAAGIDMSAGSPYARWLRDTWHGLGLGQRDEGSAPRSDLERYGQAFLRGTGSAVIPVGGTLGFGSKLATRTPSLATQASAARTALRESLVDAAKSPGAAVALEVGAGAGSYIGEEAANDLAPGNPYATMAGQLVGGLGGGLAAGRVAQRVGARSSGDTVVPARTPDTPDAAMLDDAAPMVERDGALFAKLADGREVPIPIDPWGKPGVTWTVNGWEALVDVAPDGSGRYGPQGDPRNSLPSPYRDLANRLNDATPRPMGAPDNDTRAPLMVDGQPVAFQDPRAANDAPTIDLPRLDAPATYLEAERGIVGDLDNVKASYGRNPLLPNRPGNENTIDQTQNTRMLLEKLDGNDFDTFANKVLEDPETRQFLNDLWEDTFQSNLPKGPDVSKTYDNARLNQQGRERFPAQTQESLDAAVKAADARIQKFWDDQYEGFKLSKLRDMPEDQLGSAAPPRSAAAPMEADTGRQVLVGPAMPPEPRQRDVIDVNAGPRPLLADTTDIERLRAAERLSPGDVLPIPATRVADVDEAAAIERGRFQREAAGNPRAALETRGYRDPADGLKIIRRKGPPDLVTWLRSQGGLALSDQDIGEFRQAGIDNKPRNDLEFAKGEDKLGKLLDDERGMPLDYAAMRAWEAGYFPDLPERPTIAEFMDALVSTHRGGSGRVFHPDDLPELDRYRAADAQYQGVKAAQQDGVTLMRDRSEPASLDDMDANAAPVEAYMEWGENAPDFAGNVRLDGLDSPQSIKRALAQVERVTGGFDAARRGRISQAETERLAGELGMTPKDLLSRRKGQAFNAEQALAARQILAKSGNELVNMAKRLKRADDAGTASDADRAAFRAAVVRHAAIQEQIAGVTAEAGRVLQQFKMVADSRNVRGDVLKSLVDAGGGADGIMDAASAIIDNADDAVRVNKIAAEAAKPTWKDKATELWYNFLLSGPRTHAVNITSNFLTSMAQIPEHLAAAAIGAPRAIIKGGDVDRVMFSETGSRVVGWMQGTREGLAQAAQTMRTGEPSDLASKVEAQTMKAISGVKGSILRTPTRLLMAEDELFKAMARRMEIHGLAVRNARKEGLRGQAARDRAAELAANPTPEMLEQAAEYGRYLTFQKKLGPGGQSISNLTNTNRWLKLFIPFTRTPINLLKFAVERSPAAPLLKEWREDFKAGGARRDLALGRAALGSGAAMMAVELARQGYLTGGGPADESARRMLEADGWQPYSLRVGDAYYSYQRLDPFSTTFGLAADYVDLQSHMTEKQKEEVSALIAGSLMQNLSSKTWLSGMSNLGEAMGDWGRYGDNFLASLAGSSVPAVAGQTAQALDPVAREAKGMMERIRSRIPFASQGLPARRDVFGDTIETANGGGLAAFSPVFTRERQNDPTARELIDAGMMIGVPSRRVDDPDSVDPRKKIELTPEQYSFYAESSGQIAKPRLDALVQSPEWPTMPTEDRQKAVSDIMREARKEARDMVMLQVRPKAIPKAPPPGIAGAPWWVGDELVEP